MAKQLSDDYMYEVMRDRDEVDLKCDASTSLSRKSTNTSDWEDGLTFIARVESGENEKKYANGEPKLC